MFSINPISHGGNIYYFGRLLGVSPFQIRDLSSSVNPLVSYYLKEKAFDLCRYLEYYPEPHSEELREILSVKLNVPKDYILIGHGSIELISLFLKRLLPKGGKALLLEPTFIAYGSTLNQVPHVEKNSFFSLNQQDWKRKIEDFLNKNKRQKPIVIICNPNNPTGWVLPKEWLREVISNYREALFLIDEAFIDFCEEESLLFAVQESANLVVFRSLTKFYGLAGLRVGYMVAQSPYIEVLAKELSLWNVDTLTQIIAKVLLLDKEFERRSKEFFLQEKVKFERTFKEEGIVFYPSRANFYLFFLPKGREFWNWLLREKRILIRNCENFCGLSSDYLRVSVKDTTTNDLFLEALKEWLRLW
ncbi:MAG: aminotransferase class I/II-fold pyridoxal phosphate-dependent enzyme [Caldimicrobium sp.]|nr:aminotransferase class I/II-fold pyridoxal phosphate-dependent enzyme [Caldimicrobium sp.]MCX7872914.1 aminotransferase class I/II-fold pyridoxal phosphate-dependent enzyme [Caldimicrobium sp.]MDW8094485.1 aminotransferase class I/II-fold pyridoxal phosphate-dependent enzyme [Caldimicrobium sp.]